MLLILLANNPGSVSSPALIILVVKLLWKVCIDRQILYSSYLKGSWNRFILGKTLQDLRNNHGLFGPQTTIVTVWFPPPETHKEICLNIPWNISKVVTIHFMCNDQNQSIGPLCVLWQGSEGQLWQFNKLMSQNLLSFSDNTWRSVHFILHWSRVRSFNY